MAAQEKWQGLKKVNRYVWAIFFILVDSSVSLIWLWAVLVLLGRVALRPTEASTQAFVRAYLGGPSMLFLAAAWVGFVVWLSETYVRTKDILGLVRRFLRITAFEFLLFPLFHMVMILLTRQIVFADWIIGGSTGLLAFLFWKGSRVLESKVTQQ